MKNEEQLEIFDVSNIKANTYFFIQVKTQFDEFKKKIIDDKITVNHTLNRVKLKIVHIKKCPTKTKYIEN